MFGVFGQATVPWFQLRELWKPQADDGGQQEAAI